MTDPGGRPFLAAHWRHLAMLNYEVDPAILVDLVPAGTEPDAFDGKTFVSMVAFQFRDTRVLGVGIPFHRDFEEVNLRFYVRRETGREVRRGVVFVKEIVPRRAIAAMARWLYNENYVALPTRHTDEMGRAPEPRIEYAWRHAGREDRLAVRVAGAPAPIDEGSEESFITEHYWGYARQRDGGTVEYRVVHPRWRVWHALGSEFDCDVAALYGDRYAPFLAGPPSSAFLAEGSAVDVHRGERIPG